MIANLREVALESELCAKLTSNLSGCVSRHAAPTGQDPQILQALLLMLFSSLTPPFLFTLISCSCSSCLPHSLPDHTHLQLTPGTCERHPN